MDAFDSDVLIYAAVAGHPLGRRVRSLLRGSPGRAGVERPAVGSVLLLPELLAKPTRDGEGGEVAELRSLLAHVELLPADLHTATLAVGLGASYGLRAADALHLATAVVAGADRFVTNNAKDFPRSIQEIDIVYPSELADGDR